MVRQERVIVAIGGGLSFIPCREPETLAIDRMIYKLGARRNGGEVPRVLFIPTASDDDILYCHGTYVNYHLRLGAEFDHLRILAESLSDKQIRDKIAWADIIYVGGGNTLRMMSAWRKRGVDELLKEAYDECKVLCGISAGASCWFDWGLSDSHRYTNPKGWKPIRVRGLGLIPCGFCPHFDSEASWCHSAFDLALEKTRGSGVAVEDNCAFELLGERFRFLESQPSKCGSVFKWLPTSQTVARHPFLFGRRNFTPPLALASCPLEFPPLLVE
ncbi:MAG: peptidase E [Candidatus Paceibacterota bacterium]